MIPPTWGWLVDQGPGRLVLVSRDGQRWPAGPGSMVRYVAGGPRNTVEGFHRAPRPWVYDSRGKPVVAGDYLEIHFLDGNPQRPVVAPGVQALDPEDPDFHPPNPLGEDPNPIRGRWAARDPRTGAVTGHVQLRALDGTNALELVVGGPMFGDGVILTLDFDAGRVDVKTPSMRVYNTSAELASPVLVDNLAGQSLHTMLAAALVELMALPTAFGVPTTQTATLIGLLQAGTYKSTITETE